MNEARRSVSSFSPVGVVLERRRGRRGTCWPGRSSWPRQDGVFIDLLAAVASRRRNRRRSGWLVRSSFSVGLVA
ncbi:MAG: hypothetical protein MZV64_44010 [Ignavibacteriales bacterium]|nr:hypothetical protein [Ignavibacteriales bacterium]